MLKLTSTDGPNPDAGCQVASGGNGAHPTYSSLVRHDTHAGAHSYPGTHNHPNSVVNIQRP